MAGLGDPHKPLLEIPVSATFGLLAVFVCFAIAYDLAKQFRLEASVSAAMATLVFLMVQLQRGEAMGDEVGDLFLNMGGLGSEGLFTAILIALVSVRVFRLTQGRKPGDPSSQKCTFCRL